MILLIIINVVLIARCVYDLIIIKRQQELIDQLKQTEDYVEYIKLRQNMLNNIARILSEDDDGSVHSAG